MTDNTQFSTVNERLAALRNVMREEHLAACIFPSTDPHHGEYVPERWKGREWISGFNGSAGTAVVTMTSAALWTDSRYFIAAEEQLKGTPYQLMKLKMPDTPSIARWLGRELTDSPSKEVAIDGMVYSENDVQSLVGELCSEGGLTLRTNFDALDRIWTDRPEVPLNKVDVHPLQYSGETTVGKLVRIREALRRLHADGMLVSALDDIAWTLNLRGTDIQCNPLFVAYLLIDSQGAILYIDPRKLTEAAKTHLHECGIDIMPYQDVRKGLADYFEYNILLDPAETSHTLYKTVKARKIVSQKSPIPAMKAVKNSVEINGYRRAMEKDGVAMVKFLRWLLPAVERGGVTEMSADKKLTSLRAEQEGFKGRSFDTIAGYEAHGAIVHYEATPDTDCPLQPRGLLLLDSGAQYLDGTTDITRTIPLGPVTDEQRRVYTLVLKGHIALSQCKFPSGASGTQLDMLARQYLWNDGMNYLHGTGHGVGQYLCVHEGPHQFRMEWMPAPIVSGMTVTNEPGMYLEGRFGVRTENVMLAVPYRSTQYGEFLQFEPLTLCPIDTSLIERELMTQDEIKWLNDYHAMVYERLAPYLDNDERQWLSTATKALT